VTSLTDGQNGLYLNFWTAPLTLDIKWLWIIFFNQLWFQIDDAKDAKPSLKSPTMYSKLLKVTKHMFITMIKLGQ